jgi:hypothetical protein
MSHVNLGEEPALAQSATSIRIGFTALLGSGLFFWVLFVRFRLRFWIHADGVGFSKSFDDAIDVRTWSRGFDPVLRGRKGVDGHLFFPEVNPYPRVALEAGIHFREPGFQESRKFPMLVLVLFGIIQGCEYHDSIFTPRI